LFALGYSIFPNRVLLSVLSMSSIKNLKPIEKKKVLKDYVSVF
jgi:hypothetical protein